MKKLLFVEDEALIAFLFEDALSEAGYHITSAFDGQSALTLIKSRDSSFDGLITDVRLPGTITGWDVASAMREVNPSAAVVFMTGDSIIDCQEKGVEGSVLHHKPVAVDDVVASLSTLLS